MPLSDTFDVAPGVYDTFARLTVGPLLDYLAANLPDGGERAVDLGCGTGIVTVWLAARYADVLGVDPAEAMLELARERGRPGVRLERRSLEEVSAARDGRFDLVLSTFAMHHVAEPEQALERIRDLVRPGGLAVVVDVVGAHRSRLRQQVDAARTLALDLARRRRTVGEAVDLYRAATHRTWLDHVAADEPLTVAEFDRRYLGILRGATVTALPGCRALLWHSTFR